MQKSQAKNKRKPAKSRVKIGRRGVKITEDTPLTAIEVEFIKNYIRFGNASEAAGRIDVIRENKSYAAQAMWANKTLKQPNVKAEIRRIMEELKNEAVADASEVMKYFTSVMRGEVKDQFGLDAPLSERTKAAQELAKRTIDIENRKAGEPDQVVGIKLDWTRTDNGTEREGE